MKKLSKTDADLKKSVAYKKSMYNLEIEEYYLRVIREIESVGCSP